MLRKPEIEISNKNKLIVSSRQFGRSHFTEHITQKAIDCPCDVVSIFLQILHSKTWKQVDPSWYKLFHERSWERHAEMMFDQR
jgi:hypothetical protein